MVLALVVYPLALSLVSAFTVGDGQPGLDNFVKALELYGTAIVFTFVIVSSSMSSSAYWRRQ
jgi:ABC-type sugar transport system permease subunit